ncbi:voltage-gated chloride channel family protein [Streptomyces poriticola]|uniref:chloride channel protein n=1 Tax=Streptomyces poriticola TaxID=3120506 RepID=UPI002FCE62CA
MSAPANAAVPQAEQSLRDTVLSRGYLRLLLLCVLLGVPIALACFFFVGLQHLLQHWVWESAPEALGYAGPPWWWPLPALVLAGLILAPIVTRVPGSGGHLPVNGLGGAPVGPKELPGTVLAALATLPLGVVLGPEAPLLAIGSGLALLAVRRSAAADAKARAVVATAGSTAAISTILGGPIAAAVLLIEGAGLGGARLVALLLPCLLASAAGALVFTGFGDWTGLETGALALGELPSAAGPDVGDFLWGLPVAALIAVLVTLGRELGRSTVGFTRRGSKAARTVACATAVGVCITAYALITGRSPAEAALSGQATLAELAADPHAWSVGALVALVACKGLAWAVSLGSLRGGPIFPAVLLGTATATAFSGLPGFGTAPALGLGIAAAASATTGLPLASAVLAALLLGGDAAEQMPLIVAASVVAFIVGQLVRRQRPEGATDTAGAAGAAR